jgi:hypothetical protein
MTDNKGAKAKRTHQDGPSRQRSGNTRVHTVRPCAPGALFPLARGPESALLLSLKKVAGWPSSQSRVPANFLEPWMLL